MDSIEMDELNPPPSNTSDKDVLDHEEKDGVILSWAWAATILILLLASILILFPSVLLFAAETADERRSSLTPLEAFLSLHFGILLAAVGLTLLLNVPSTSPVIRVQSNTPSHPLLVPLTTASILSSFVSYNTTTVGSLSFIVSLGSGLIGLWGLWVILFAGSSFKSKKTGADKHTSSFIFSNKASASVQKKRWKERQGRSI